jgi:hypothetical protein
MSDLLLQQPSSSTNVTPIAADRNIVHLEAIFAVHSPSDHVRLAAGISPLGVLVDHLPSALVVSLRKDVCADEGDLAALLLTGFAVLLSRYTRQDQINVDVAIAYFQAYNAGERPQVAHTSMAIGSELADAPPFTAVLQHVRQTLSCAVDVPDREATAFPDCHADRTVTFSYQRVLDDDAQPDAAKEVQLCADLRLEVVTSIRGMELT